MNKQAAFVLVLALPGLVMADYYRFRPSPDINPPDALRWDMRAHRPELTAVPSRPPSWASVVTPGCSRSGFACKQSVPQYQVRCQSQPECQSHVNTPILWPHSPRADEQKTVLVEQRLKEATVQSRTPAK